ncbi:MAG: hypothetical protein FJZ59_00205 [Chlamydiae bacterium]|nr:hypothetical protein [Chlamydiota bacterium]
MKLLHLKIWLIVFLIHSTCLISFISSTPKIKPPNKKLVVVTKEFVKKEAPPCLHTKIETKALPQISSIEKTKVKKTPPLKEKKTPPKTSKQILKKIEKRKPKSALNLQKKVSSPQKTAEKESFPSYMEATFDIFRSLLVLPEKGRVKLTLTVTADGKIDKITKESSESQKNLDYLLDLLPHLTLPPLEKNQETTFTVLFTNE